MPPQIAAMDLFVVPTLSFALLYVFVIVRLDRRPSSGSTSHGIQQRNGLRVRLQRRSPGTRLRAIIRDRDGLFGAIVKRRLRAMGIRDKPIAPASPWQNDFRRTVDRVDPP